jgi:preprotein translocase subunit YajC
MNSISQGLVLLQAAAGSSSGQMVSTLVTFGLVFVVFYFLIIRPQNKKQKEMKR